MATTINVLALTEGNLNLAARELLYYMDRLLIDMDRHCSPTLNGDGFMTIFTTEVISRNRLFRHEASNKEAN